MEQPKKKIKRSRLGCHRCKKLKIKCSEERPACGACTKVGCECDYSLKLTWGGRPYKNKERLGQVSAPVAPAPKRIHFVVESPKTDVKVEDPFLDLALDLDKERASPVFELELTRVFGLELRVFGPSPAQENEAKSDQSDSVSDLSGSLTNSIPDGFGSGLSSPGLSHSPGVSSPSWLGDIYSPLSVPPPLTPLPEMLVEYPYYRLLLHFWVHVAAHQLVPAPLHMYKDNPFKVLLPQMAMHYPGVLTTILAFSARSRDMVLGSNEHQEVIGQLLNQSCGELLVNLQDQREATSDGTLANILLLSAYEVISSRDFDKHRAHTTGASQLVVARAGNSPRSLAALASHDESNLALFLMRWFVYVDVLGALSATRGRDKYLRGYTYPVENVLFDSAPKRDIDYLLGFDVRLVTHFINIALLVREVAPAAQAVPHWVTVAALELHTRFTRDYELGEARRLAFVDTLINDKLRRHSPGAERKITDLVKHDNILRATNKLFFDMGVLNLYRRVLQVPLHLFLVQDLADEMLLVLELALEPQSLAEICTIFCHFCAGCETRSSEKRALVTQRFTRLAQAGNANALKSLLIMQRCWDTGEDWGTAATALDIDLVLM